MQHTIPDDELADMQKASYDHVGQLPGVTAWFRSTLMEAFVAGAKHQYQAERNRKTQKSKISGPVWFLIANVVCLAAMFFGRDNLERACFFMLSMIFNGMMLLAALIEEKTS